MSKTVPLPAIQFGISTWFKYQNSSISNNLVWHKYTDYFYLTHRWDPIRCYHSGPEWTWERWQWRDTTHSPKLQHNWNLAIRLICVISGHSLGEVSPLCRNAVGVIYRRSRVGKTKSKQPIKTIFTIKETSHNRRLMWPGGQHSQYAKWLKEWKGHKYMHYNKNLNKKFEILFRLVYIYIYIYILMIFKGEW